MSKTPLTVYRASAGSGKTFRLAVEYIKLLIEDPSSYRHILAVTFTNKATEEMKMRILSQLYGLANGYEDSNDYMEKICQELGRDRDFVSMRARTALSEIIHHYHYFKVETIDKFFQRILRNLAHELDLSANLRIELDGKQVEHQAVDEMINQLKRNDTVMKWLMQYIKTSIDSDKSWNVIKQVKSFGENIFNDSYRSHHEAMRAVISQSDFFTKFIGQIKSLKDDSTEKLSATNKAHAQQFFNIIQGYSVDDFDQKSKGVYGYFEKLLNGSEIKELSKTVKKCMADPDVWGRKSSKNYKAIVSLANKELVNLLIITENDRRHYTQYIITADIILKNLYQLRLLIDIEEKVREITQESGSFLLSDTQGMLHDLIEDSDTPFIFEKIGGTLHHIMIDEFQDTGRVQWENFKILLRNCMDQHTGNLIVGDVKQSIYRWRSGDWRLLNSIDKEFDEKRLHITDLKTNFRSSRHVINFNNAFFLCARQQELARLQEYVGEEAQELATAYRDVEQQIPPKKGDEGFVRVELIPRKEYAGKVMDHISQVIHTLLDHGVQQSNIAILARNNIEITQTTLYFHENDQEVNVVSDEAFRLDSSIALEMLINSLRVLADPNDRLSKASLVKNYQKVILGVSLDDTALLQPLPSKDSPDPLDEWLPKGYIGDSNRQRLMSLPLNELIERLFDLFDLNKLESQSSYICAFYDHLNDFLSDRIGDIETFLNSWDETISSKHIQCEQVDGIRMVTIHKSKGLEFDHVILPFCNWTMEKSNIIWCDCEEAPFNELPILPVRYTKDMANSLYSEDYLHEHLQNSVDNLNLLYVAFTRAKNSLTVIGQKDDSKSKKETFTHSNRSILIEHCLSEVQRSLTGSRLDTQEDGTLIFEYGSLDNSGSTKKDKKTENVFLQQEDHEPFKIQTYRSKAKFLQSNASSAFISDEESGSRNSYIIRGTLLHSIFSRLRDINDINRVLDELTMEGVLYDEVSPEELQKMLHHALHNEQVRSWFSPHWEVHNECAILYRDPKSHVIVERRPDRVISDEHQIIVIDFKFGKPDKEHKEQVKLYMDKLREMDSRPVKGYLWYVTKQTIEDVNNYQ